MTSKPLPLTTLFALRAFVAVLISASALNVLPGTAIPLLAYAIAGSDSAMFLGTCLTASLALLLLLSRTFPAASAFLITLAVISAPLSAFSTEAYVTLSATLALIVAQMALILLHSDWTAMDGDHPRQA